MKVFEKISMLLNELSGMENICLEHQLQKDLGLDSLQMVTLLLLLEDTFHFVLEESDMNPFDLITVEHIVKLVEKYLGGDSNALEEEN
ncbi:MAG: hypothetical protein J6S14_08530 [Clostridia bacterium]|nr:hypothetical protein [Clostridia bacterium]